jgi:hypothetical protein
MNEIQYRYQLDEHPEQYPELWKWFTDDAAKIKDRMWTMATFFYTFLGALLGFVGKQLVSGDSKNLIENVQEPGLVLVVALAGCVLSAYGIFMLCQYGKHIRIGWNRADYIRFRIEGLSEIWCFNDNELLEKDKKLRKNHPAMIPKVAVVLIILMAFFFLIFACILLLTLIL